MSARLYESFKKGLLQFYMPVFAPLTASEKNELRVTSAATLPKHLARMSPHNDMHNNSCLVSYSIQVSKHSTMQNVLSRWKKGFHPDPKGKWPF